MAIQRPPANMNPSADVSLAISKDFWNYLRMYKSCLFQLVPVHPAAMYEPNIRYVLTTTDGAEAKSSMSLSVNVVMALGA